MKSFLDTNCLLRYLLQDVPEQSEQVAAVVAVGARTAPEFLSECVYVLSGKVYGLSRKETADVLALLLEDVDCEHRVAMLYALELFGKSTLDFPDCILAARMKVEGDEVVTFDKKLLKVLASI